MSKTWVLESGQISEITRSKVYFEELVEFHWLYYAELAFQRNKIREQIKEGPAGWCFRPPDLRVQSETGFSRLPESVRSTGQTGQGRFLAAQVSLYTCNAMSVGGRESTDGAAVAWAL